MQAPVTLKAYAKINIGLRILRKRPDGFHDLETLFHRIDLHDDLVCVLADAISVESDSTDAPGGESNLCFRAAAALARRSGVTQGVAIRLAKRIPVGAGLGGGSSDAATLLLALPRIWGINISRDELHTIACGLGSDVPYFLRDGSAAASGRGEVLEHFPLDLPYAILLCNPGIHVATGWAYSLITPHADPRHAPLRSIVERGILDPPYLAAHLVNDFEEPVFRTHPLLREVKDRMLEEGASYAAMSGSGSSLFGFFPDPLRAGILADEFRTAGYLASVTPPHFQPEPV